MIWKGIYYSHLAHSYHFIWLFFTKQHDLRYVQFNKVSDFPQVVTVKLNDKNEWLKNIESILFWCNIVITNIKGNNAHVVNIFLGFLCVMKYTQTQISLYRNIKHYCFHFH